MKYAKKSQSKKKPVNVKSFSSRNSVFFASANPTADPIKKTIEPATTSAGYSLPEEAKNFFEPKFNYSFNNVKIHTGDEASKSAEKLNANAYTYENNIVFNEGKYKPGTKEGNKLLAHELAHVHLHSGTKVIARQPKPSPPQPTQAEIEKGKQQRAAATLFWTDLKTNFPDDGRKLAGSYHDDTIDYLSTDFKEGEVIEQGIKVSYSAPRIIIGKKYTDEKDVAKRQGYIKTEIDKIDVWRFEQNRIDNDDLTNSKITGKLDGLDLFKKGEYIQKLAAKTKIKNDKVQEYLRRKMPSTQAMAGATPTAAGGFELQFANIKIIVKPDVFDDAALPDNSGETQLEPENSPTYTVKPAYNWLGDKITSITPMPTVPDVIYRVETHYGPNADPAGASGYGAGTTTADKAAGNTSLRFHEGSHGAVFIEAIKSNFAANPYPVFTGKIGDNKGVFEKTTLPDYGAKVNAFRKVLADAIEASTQKVDCVGKTIEQFHKEKGKVSKVKCKP